MSQLWLGFGGLLVTLLLAGVFTLGSLDLPFEIGRWNEVLVLYAVSTFIVAALLVFGLILTRSLLRLWIERRAAQLGSRFKTKMVLGAMAISLLPVVFMFFISYALLNRTLGRWFPRPLELSTEQSQALLNDFGRTAILRLNGLAEDAVAQASSEKKKTPRTDPAERAVQNALQGGADAAWVLEADGRFRGGTERWWRQLGPALRSFEAPITSAQDVRALPSGIELWQAANHSYITGSAPLLGGRLTVGRRIPDDFLKRFATIQTQVQAYDLQKQRYRTLKAQMLLVLFLFTLLLLFAATWFAFFLSKQVTVPIEALAEATREVSAGNFDYQVQVQAQDELGILVHSFNRMTAQLADSRRQIDEFTRSLQQAVQELERRRKLMEAILENIPTGVLSLDDAGAIVRINPAATKIFGEQARTARTVTELAGEDAACGVQQLMRRSLRMGAASRELEIALPDRVVHAAVTVSSLGPRRSNPGFIVVVDDLTELLRAQKAAAWQEVAQRIAHEIKNPLTPIQLSAQRLGRYLERQRTARAESGDARLAQLVGECAGLIEREVAALESLVDEFSQFARFPTARLVPADPNAIVSSALEIFGGRLEGIQVRTLLAAGLPAVKADPELLRRVLVNLIDNAAEALEGSPARELSLSTRSGADGETVEIIVADSGHGISPEDKDKLFLPHFSTKDRGTGLGLAIAGRIIEEHHGTIHVEDNSPVGARFVIQLPVAEVPAAPLTSET
jgi:PAS domain S-box-containing protein